MRVVAGWDGGGTKTAVAIADESGAILRTFTSGALNLNGQDEASVRGSVEAIMQEIGAVCGGRLERCEHICIGAAGVSNPAMVSRLTGMVRSTGFEGGLTITGDHETALFGGLESSCGMILIAGTGSICFGRNTQGMTHRTGGGGYLVDDEGSGYSIGRELISAALKASDGRIDNELIAPMVFRQLQVESVRELIGFVYAPSTNKRDIAAVAPLLTELCNLGDREALSIAARAAQALFELVLPVAERLSLQEGQLALTGSVLLRNETIRHSLTELLSRRYPTLEVFPAKRDAAQGAALMALQQLQKHGLA